MRKSYLAILLVAVILLSSGCAADINFYHTAKNEYAKSASQTTLNAGKIHKSSKTITTVDVPEESYCKNALHPLDIHTYDGSNQANHPKVLYFDIPWHGWKYWMSYTPYPNGNADYENPSIAVSNDGVNWKTPNGLKNPVIKDPADVAKGGHYSDPHFVIDGQTMELWYRYNPANSKGTGTSHNINTVLMRTSQNGIDWSYATLILSDKSKYFSPAIIFDNGEYKLWYSDTDGKLHYRESADLKDWSDPVTVNLDFPGHCIWHQDVIKTGRGYDVVFSSFKKGAFSKNDQCLYYAFSPDGINFNKPILLLAPSKGQNRLDNQMIYRSSIVKVDGQYKIYYSAMNKNKEWHIFVTNFDSDDKQPL